MHSVDFKIQHALKRVAIRYHPLVFKAVEWYLTSDLNTFDRLFDRKDRVL